LNWGPLRPERSALPGCATPRAPTGYPLRGSDTAPTCPHQVRDAATRFRRTPGETQVPASGFGPTYTCRVAGRDEIVEYANTLLDVERWPEFAPPGLQVVGAEDVTLLLCGVSSSRELFEHAADVGADMVLVHHGLFWRNEPLVVDRRLRGRLEAL
jgi:hypothetical protein